MLAYQSRPLTHATVAILPFIFAVSQIVAIPPESSNIISTNRDAGALPIYFEPNIGQADESARFIARAGGAHIFFTPSAVVWR